MFNAKLKESVGKQDIHVSQAWDQASKMKPKGRSDLSFLINSYSRNDREDKLCILDGLINLLCYEKTLLSLHLLTSCVGIM